MFRASLTSVRQRMVPPLAILVCEHDGDMRTLLVDYLQPFGFPVFEALNGYELLEVLNSHDPRLIVTDIEMPGTGLGYLKTLRQRQACPILVLSGFGGIPQAEALAMGASAWLEKPFRMGQLRKIVAWLLKAG